VPLQIQIIYIIHSYYLFQICVELFDVRMGTVYFLIQVININLRHITSLAA